MFRRLTYGLLAALALTCAPTAQEEHHAHTADNPRIELEILSLELRPLQEKQLEAEAEAWLALLASTNAEISRQQIVARSAENEQRRTLDPEIATNLEHQVRLVDRLRLVLAALKARGGEVERFEKYIDASTGFRAREAGGIAPMLAFAVKWFSSPEGGIRLGLNVIKFLVTLVVFSVLASVLSKVVKRALGRLRGSTDLLRDFFVHTTRNVTFFIGIVVALSMLDIDIGPFLAAIGAAGFVIGFALQGTLSNFAAGIMILFYRPYDIGQVVTVAGTTGKVDQMSLVSTTLRLPDNQTVVVPNNSIWGGVITNVTGQATRRVDMLFGCSYGDDLKKVQRVLEELVKSHPKVHAEPAPVVKVHALADSSIHFVVRPWTATADYWDVFWDVTRQVKERFDAEGISIPFPQREVHVHTVTE